MPATRADQCLYSNNHGVVKNISVSELTHNKKHNSINYHVICEVVASGILRVGKEDTATIMADPLTKILPYSHKQELLGKILWEY